MGPMGNINPYQLAMNFLQQHPEVANTPQGQQLARILQSGDDRAGQEMAMNICNSYGVSPMQALMHCINSLKK